jgi:hypothetical protein
VDSLLPELTDCGIAGDELEIIHRESNRPLGTSRAAGTPDWNGGFTWSELTVTSKQYTRAVPRYLIVMACAGIIAVFGIPTAAQSSSSAQWRSARTCCRSARPAPVFATRRPRLAVGRSLSRRRPRHRWTSPPTRSNLLRAISIRRQGFPWGTADWGCSPTSTWRR